MPASPASLDVSMQRRLRDVAGRFATGVTVVTTATPEGVHAMTVNGFLSISLDPPLVGVSIGNASAMRAALDASGHFGVSVLASEQRSLSAHFAGRRDPGATPSFTQVGAIPILDGALARICSVVVDRHPAGDHTLFIGEVTHLDWRAGQPLIFHAGGYRALEAEAGWSDTWYHESAWV